MISRHRISANLKGMVIKMRVITGAARGRLLKTVEGLDVRPTAEKVKESIFSAIQFEIEGARMLDLFCGSGQMGIEGLSRGASVCTFVDNDRRSIEVTKKNLINVGLFSSARVIQSDFLSFLSGGKEQYDIAFLDPPYSQGMLQQALPLLVRRMNPAGVILCEHEAKDILPEEAEGFTRKKEYSYGRMKITTYRQG